MSVEEQELMDLVDRLRKRSEIRKQITTRKSVQEGQPDRLCELLEEAADTLMEQYNEMMYLKVGTGSRGIE